MRPAPHGKWIWESEPPVRSDAIYRQITLTVVPLALRCGYDYVLHLFVIIVRLRTTLSAHPNNMMKHSLLTADG